MAQVAIQWTAMSEDLVNQIPEVINHQYQRWSDLTQVGNLAEPAV
jgi:hypothetical protein